MKISKLRSIIRESISNNLKEIEDVAENAAMEAKLNAYTEAIEKVNKKIEMAESLEEMQELVDPTKLNELKKHLKTLEKSKEKLEKVKTKKNKGKEVVTDEPVEEAEIEEVNNWNAEEVDDPWDAGQTKHQPMDEVDLSDEEKEELRKKAETNDKEYNIMNESFLKMQKLAGVITESQYNQKIKLLNEEVTVGGTYTASMPTSSDGKERIDVKVKVLGKDRSNEDEFIVTPLEDKDYTNAASGQQNRFEKGKQYGVEAKFIKLGVNELFGFGNKTKFKDGDLVYMKVGNRSSEEFETTPRKINFRVNKPQKINGRFSYFVSSPKIDGQFFTNGGMWAAEENIKPA